METLVENPDALLYCNLHTTSYGICHHVRQNMMALLGPTAYVVFFHCNSQEQWGQLSVKRTKRMKSKTLNYGLEISCYLRFWLSWQPLQGFMP